MLHHSLRPLLLILLIAFTTTIPAQKQSPRGPAQGNQKTEGRPAPDVIGYWNSLAARSSEPLAVSWNVRAGTPASIFGKISAPPNDGTVQSARSFLRSNAPLFKMDPETSDLQEARSFDSVLGHHFVFKQMYRGVPVYNAQVALHYDRAGTLIAVNNSYEPGVNLQSVVPRLSRASATGRALGLLNRSNSPSVNAELIVLSENNNFFLAWRLIVATDGPTWELFIDANDGKLIAGPKDINRYATGVGQVFKVNAVVATHDNTLRDNADSAAAVPASAYSIVALEGLSGNGSLDGLFASSAGTKKRAFDTTNSFIFDRGNDGFSETMGYYYIDYAERYIQSLGFNNVNNRQQVFSVNKLKVDNSFYSPQSEEITYGLGGVDDAEDAEVILHEYGHSIQDNQVPGFGTTLESGAMGEGFGDYWGASVGAQFSGGFQDLCLADWDATSYSSTNPPCLRRLDSTKHYPEDIQGEVHDDGEIWSAALWQIRNSIGATDADTVIIAAHFLLAPNATFNQGANAIVTAASSLGFKRNQLNNIRKILGDRGFTITV